MIVSTEFALSAASCADCPHFDTSCVFDANGAAGWLRFEAVATVASHVPKVLAKKKTLDPLVS